MDQPLAERAPSAWWSASLPDFLITPDEAILGTLAYRAAQAFRGNEMTQLSSWSAQLALLPREIHQVCAERADKAEDGLAV